MERVLVLSHVEEGRIGKHALETITTGIELGGALSVGLIGASVQEAADGLAGCGAERFLAVVGQEFAQPRYSSDVAAVEALIRASEATVVLAPATSRFARALPGAAQRVRGRVDTKITGLAFENDQLRVRRWFYRQRIRATLTRAERPWLLLLESGVNPPWAGQGGNAQPETVAVDLPPQRTRIEGYEDAVAGEQTVRPDAELLFVAGAGWTKKQADGRARPADAERLIRGFLDKTGASLGSSKSLVDQSGEGQAVLPFFTHLNQVGQTGSTPRHPKGLATCCHGEEPHVVGWRFINERRAVNLDPACGWSRGKADVLYVADAFDLIARVNELLVG